MSHLFCKLLYSLHAISPIILIKKLFSKLMFLWILEVQIVEGLKIQMALLFTLEKYR